MAAASTSLWPVASVCEGGNESMSEGKTKKVNVGYRQIRRKRDSISSNSSKIRKKTRTGKQTSRRIEDT